MPARLAKLVLWAVALFYGYGALVHVVNILGLSGFDWSRAPLKWQALDVVVLVGFFLGSKLAYLAFYLAAIGQIVLYTLLRSWILDVPAEFAVTPEQTSYLSVLATFHVVTFLLVSAALRFARPAARE